MVGLVLIEKLHCGGCVIQRSEQVLFHVSDRAAVLCKALQHKADMVSVQLHKATAYHLGGLIVAGDADGAFRRTDHIHQQLQDFFQRVLLVWIVCQECVVGDVLRNKLSVPLSQSRFVSFRFPTVIPPERSEGKGIRITKISIILISIIRSRF